MPRDLSSDFIAALEALVIRPVFFVSIQFTSATTFLWSGIGDITWDGHTWTGVGSLGTISSATEVNDVSAQNITLALSGIPNDLLGQAITEVRQTQAARVWFGSRNDDGTVIADPTKAFEGRTDVPSVNEGADTSTLSITCENPLIELSRSPGFRWTHEQQQIFYPGDLGFQYVPDVVSWNGKWGSK